jgi:hypothetical protein
VFPVDLCAYRKDSYEDHLRRLEEACLWLDIDKGRAQTYIRLVREFHKEDKRTRQHILAYNESCEVVDIHRFWRLRAPQFPGLAEKMRQVLCSGPVLREEEEPKKANNRPRNDAFVFYLAGMLLSVNVQIVAIDGVLAEGEPGPENADITLRNGTDLVDIQCKRPQSSHSFERRVKEARKQIESTNRIGAIAIDCSAVVRPSGGVLRSASIGAANSFIDQTLQNLAESTITNQLRNYVLGFFLFARVPVNTIIAQSQIVSYQGERFTYFQRESLSTWLLFNNRKSRNPDLLWSVFQKMKDAGRQS